MITRRLVAQGGLDVEILEALTDLSIATTAGQPGTWILVRLSVANTIDPSVHIKSWHLDLLSADRAIWLEARKVRIPSGFTFQRTPQSPKRAGPYTPEAVEAGLDEQLSKSLPPPGEKASGWLLFVVQRDLGHRLHGYEFRVTVTDTMDNPHVSVRAPGDWLTGGRFFLRWKAC